MSVGHFLGSRRKYGGALACSPHSRLSEVVETAATACVHRLFVVDTTNKPIGVISLTDIMRTVANALP